MSDEEIQKTPSEAAKRALAEAAARRAQAEEEAEPEATRPREILGREGPEPTRYGDWEHKGLISDF